MSAGNGKPRHAGISVTFAGEEWIIPALSIRQFREHYKRLFNVGEVTADNLADVVGERLSIVALAIQRNYPDVTEEDLADMLDLPSFLAVVRAIGEASGLRPASPGEPLPVAQTLTGDGSTAR